MDANGVIQAINISLTPVIIITCFYVYIKTKHIIPLLVGAAFLINFVLSNTVSLLFLLVREGIRFRNTITLLQIIYTIIKAIFTALVAYAMLLFLRPDGDSDEAQK